MGERYPAIIRLWENTWPEFVPFLQFDRDIRTVTSTANAIESINANLRSAVNARGHYLNEQAALKCLYLAVMSLDPTGRERKPVLGKIGRHTVAEVLADLELTGRRHV